MKKSRLFIMGLIGLLGIGGLLVASHISQWGVESEKAISRPQNPLPYHRGQVVVKDMSNRALATLRAQVPHIKVEDRFGPRDEYTFLRFDPGYSVAKVISLLKGECTWSEPVYIRRLVQDKKSEKKDEKKDKKKGEQKTSEMRPPRDSFFDKQWGFDNYGQDAPGGIVGKIGADISLLKAWQVDKGSEKVRVAILDTGVDYEHPDLRENMWVNEKEKYGIKGHDDDGNGYVDDIHGWNFVKAEKYGDQAGSPDPMDDNGHGTHCAGIVGAQVDNLKGVAGINWNVSIVALKFLNAFGSGDSLGVYRAIEYAIKNKVQVINCSFGSGQRSKLESDAFKMAQDAGIVISAAAGNDGYSNDREKSFPSNYEYKNIISVAATDNMDKLASFSNFGAEKVHVAAPGVAIFSTFPKNRYGTASGTSMAAPMVTGTVALLLSHVKGISPEQVRERIMATSDPVIDLVGRVKSWGRINVYNCLKDIRPPRESFDEKKIKTEEYSLESIHYPTHRVDHVYKIVRPKAKYMRVHFKKILTDPNWDYVEILDKDNRKVDSITRYLSNSWSAWVKGDTIKIRLYAEPPMAFDTRQEGNLMVITMVKGKASRTWGFEIDKIGYIHSK